MISKTGPSRAISKPDDQAKLHRTWVLLTVSLCTMLYSLTVTIVNVTLPQLQGALSATPDQVAWVVTLNLVATAVITVPFLFFVRIKKAG